MGLPEAHNCKVGWLGVLGKARDIGDMLHVTSAIRLSFVNTVDV